MKKLMMTIMSMMSVLAFASFSAQAGLFDAETDVVEIANAMAHCPSEVAQLLPAKRRFHVNNVVGRFTQLSEGVTVKGYDISTQEGGGFERPTKGSVLSIEVKVTQPSNDVQDAPSTLSWNCLIH